MSKSTKKDLINSLAEAAGSSKAEATRWLGYFVESIHGLMDQNDSVSLAGLGTFKRRPRAARTCYNPKDRTQVIEVPARTTIGFKPTPRFRAIVDETMVVDG
jgi:nucleoid DNA-binding protein